MNKKRLVDYDHILRIVGRCAEDGKSARDALQLLIFSFGK